MVTGGNSSGLDKSLLSEFQPKVCAIKKGMTGRWFKEGKQVRKLSAVQIMNENTQ